MRFTSRQDAGQQLGEALRGRFPAAQVVLGLPRGGVVVAAEVARILHVPLDVLVVRKIGHPQHREFAVGALAENDVVLIDDSATRFNPLARLQLDDVIREETSRLKDYRRRFHIRHEPAEKSGTVLIVDDGLATGATTEAAVLSAKKSGWQHIVVAIPVASKSAFERLGRTADDVFALFVDPDFVAVGAYYDAFPQTSDEEVLALL